MSKRLAERLTKKPARKEKIDTQPEVPGPKKKYEAPRLKGFQKKTTTKPKEFKGMQRALAEKKAKDDERAEELARKEAEMECLPGGSKKPPAKKPPAKKAPPKKSQTVGKSPTSSAQKPKQTGTEDMEAAIDDKQTAAMEAQMQADEAKCAAEQAQMEAQQMQLIADEAAIAAEEAMTYGPHPMDDDMFMQLNVEDSFERAKMEYQKTKKRPKEVQTNQTSFKITSQPEDDSEPINIELNEVNVSFLDDEDMPEDDLLTDEECDFNQPLKRTKDPTPVMDDRKMKQYMENMQAKLQKTCPNEVPDAAYELDADGHLVVKSLRDIAEDIMQDDDDDDEECVEEEPAIDPKRAALVERLAKIKDQQVTSSAPLNMNITLEGYEPFDGTGLYEVEFPEMDVFKTMVVYCINIINQNEILEAKILERGSMPSKVLSDRTKFIGEVETEKNNIYNLSKKYIETYQEYHNRKLESTAISLYETINFLIQRIVKLRSVLYGSHNEYETSTTTVKLLLIITGVFCEECPPIPIMIPIKFDFKVQIECLRNVSESEVKLCVILQQIKNAGKQVQTSMSKISHHSAQLLDTEIERMEKTFKVNMSNFHENYMGCATMQQSSRIGVFRDIKNLLNDSIAFFNKLSEIDANNQEIRTSTIKDYFRCFENSDFYLSNLTNQFDNSHNIEPTSLSYLTNYAHIYNTFFKLNETLSLLMYRMVDHYVFECEFGLYILRDLIYLILIAHTNLTPVQMYEIRCKATDGDYSTRIAFAHKQVYKLQRKLYDSNRKMDSSFNIISSVKAQITKIKESYNLPKEPPHDAEGIRQYKLKKDECSSSIKQFEEQLVEVRGMFVLRIQHGADFKNFYYKVCTEERKYQLKVVRQIHDSLEELLGVIQLFDKAKRTEAIPREMIYRKMNLENKFQEIGKNLNKMNKDLNKTTDRNIITSIYDKMINSELVRLIDKSIIYISCLTRSKMLVDIVLGFILLTFLAIELIEVQGSDDEHCRIIETNTMDQTPDNMTAFSSIYDEFDKKYHNQMGRMTLANTAAEELLEGGPKGGVNKNAITNIINARINREKTKGQSDDANICKTLASIRDQLVFGKVDKDLINLEDDAEEIESLSDYDEEQKAYIPEEEVFQLSDDDVCDEEEDLAAVYGPPPGGLYTSDEIFSEISEEELLDQASAVIDDVVVDMDQEERIVRAMAIEEEKLQRERDEHEELGLTEADFLKGKLMAQGYDRYFTEQVDQIIRENRKLLEDENKRLQEIEEEKHYFPHGFKEARKALIREKREARKPPPLPPRSFKGEKDNFREEVLKKWTTPVEYAPLPPQWRKPLTQMPKYPPKQFQTPDRRQSCPPKTPPPSTGRQWSPQTPSSRTQSFSVTTPGSHRYGEEARKLICFEEDEDGEIIDSRKIEDEDLSLGLEKVLITPNIDQLDKSMTRIEKGPEEIQKMVETLSRSGIPRKTCHKRYVSDKTPYPDRKMAWQSTLRSDVPGRASEVPQQPPRQSGIPRRATQTTCPPQPICPPPPNCPPQIPRRQTGIPRRGSQTSAPPETICPPASHRRHTGIPKFPKK